MTNTKKGGKKFAQKKLAEDPDYFKKLSARARKPRGGKASPGSFKPGNTISVKGGKASRRGSVKLKHDAPLEMGTVKLDYEDMR